MRVADLITKLQFFEPLATVYLATQDGLFEAHFIQSEVTPDSDGEYTVILSNEEIK